ncbi:MAG TPA: type IV secretion IcmS family protein [Gammaproteobacteria bacterium]|jgi:intracellular multiplication protein IcmS|nr:type IV secretion IcmS family protein [Gammaproteobacteria bacterium]
MANQDISELMIRAARQMRGNYSLNGRPMTMEEVFNPSGLMAGIARRADQLCSLCLGYGIGVTFEEEEGAVLGVKVIFDEITPNSLRLLCMIDVLNELMRGSRPGDMTALDQLMYD